MTNNHKELLAENIIDPILLLALEEDIRHGDITSRLVIPEEQHSTMIFRAREAFVLCGMPVIKRMLTLYDSNYYQPITSSLHTERKEGDVVVEGDILGTLSGPARTLLAIERVSLNFLQRLSGIATLTREFTEAISSTEAEILDTRKTTPCMRPFQRYAVRVGGGTNHRYCLDDGILIKDNHIQLAGGIKEAISSARREREITGCGDITLQIECDTIRQVEEALEAGAQSILLDNMEPESLQKAVKIIGDSAITEASGGITLDNVREIAETGVNRISIGALTHSAASVDIGLDMIL